MYDPPAIAFVCFVVGFVLLTLGFANRDRGPGIALMWLGVVLVLGAVAYYVGSV